MDTSTTKKIISALDPMVIIQQDDRQKHLDVQGVMSLIARKSKDNALTEALQQGIASTGESLSQRLNPLRRNPSQSLSGSQLLSRSQSLSGSQPIQSISQQPAAIRGNLQDLNDARKANNKANAELTKAKHLLVQARSKPQYAASIPQLTADVAAKQAESKATKARFDAALAAMPRGGSKTYKKRKHILKRKSTIKYIH